MAHIAPGKTAAAFELPASDSNCRPSRSWGPPIGTALSSSCRYWRMTVRSRLFTDGDDAEKGRGNPIAATTPPPGYAVPGRKRSRLHCRPSRGGALALCRRRCLTTSSVDMHGDRRQIRQPSIRRGPTNIPPKLIAIRPMLMRKPPSNGRRNSRRLARGSDAPASFQQEDSGLPR
jgi:hypothetical protein